MSNSQQTTKAKASSRSVRNVAEASPINIRNAHGEVKKGWEAFAKRHGIVIGRRNLFVAGKFDEPEDDFSNSSDSSSSSAGKSHSPAPERPFRPTLTPTDES